MPEGGRGGESPGVVMKAGSQDPTVGLPCVPPRVRVSACPSTGPPVGMPPGFSGSQVQQAVSSAGRLTDRDVTEEGEQGRASDDQRSEGREER